MSGNVEQEDSKDEEGSPESGSLDDSNLQCVLCRRVCADADEMQSHLANHALDRPHKCKLCTKAFTRRRELLRHENVHTGLKPHKCSICSKAFARKDKLARHVKIHTEEKVPGKKMYCEICAVGFYKQNLYEDHLARHEFDESVEGRGDSGDEQNGHLVGSGGESDEGNSEDESKESEGKGPLQQLSANPCITVTSLARNAR